MKEWTSYNTEATFPTNLHFWKCFLIKFPYSSHSNLKKRSTGYYSMISNIWAPQFIDSDGVYFTAQLLSLSQPIRCILVKYNILKCVGWGRDFCYLAYHIVCKSNYFKEGQPSSHATARHNEQHCQGSTHQVADIRNSCFCSVK